MGTELIFKISLKANILCLPLTLSRLLFLYGTHNPVWSRRVGLSAAIDNVYWNNCIEIVHFVKSVSVGVFAKKRQERKWNEEKGRGEKEGKA